MEQNKPILFIIKGACSFGTQVTLEYLEIPYQIGITTPEIRGSKEFLKINPTGKVGALKDGDFVVAENAAILLYLTDKYDLNSLAFKQNIESRTKVYQWLSYLSSTLHTTFGQALYPERLVGKEDIDKFRQLAINRLYSVLNFVDNHLANNDYFIQSTLSIVDFQAYGILRWIKTKANQLTVNDLENRFPNIKKFFERIESLSKVQNAINLENEKPENLVKSKFSGYFTFQ